MVRKIGYLEQIVARVFVYAYNAGCWMNLAPENYGCDVKWIFHPISVSILIRLNVTMASIKVSFLNGPSVYQYVIQLAANDEF